MYRLLRALLFLLPAEPAHHLGLFALRVLGWIPALRRALRRGALPRPEAGLEVSLGGLRFPHPIALAAGLDKDAVAVRGLFALGFAAVEVGTLTPRAQPGNPKPRIFRLPEHRALINRLGFNNRGAEAAAGRLRALGAATERPGPIGINLGKNKDTPLENAAEDYLRGVDALGTLADYVVINASSPNTPGLRQLQEPEQLRALLSAVRTRLAQRAPGVPLLLKIAPDLAPEAVDEIVDVAIACGLSGLICTNTTITRPFAHPKAAEAGGLSGEPVRDLATAVIRRAYQRATAAGAVLPIVGVGGVFSAADAYQKLRAGASLVQLYTGFIYEGPGVVRRMVKELEVLLRRDGFTSVTEAIGADAAK